MTATTPQPIQGTEAPNQIEYLYERYRGLFKWVIVLIIVGLGVNYFLKWQRQSEVNEKWSGFAASIGIEGCYTDKESAQKSLTDLLENKDLAIMEQALAGADAGQAPYLLLAISRRAMLGANWDRAESALAELESKYPQHSLVLQTQYPVQIRDVIPEEDPDPEKPNKKPEYEPAVKGSAVTQMRAQIAAARVYTRPAQFAQPEVPADAPKVRFELSGEYGSFTIALMPQARLHTEKFLELARGNPEAEDEEAKKKSFWIDLSIDEIQRAGTGFWKTPMQFHLGFETTKEADRTKWTKTEPSKYQVEYEETGLSHFPGAVAARLEADGKSCADRFYICGEDYSQQDGQRVVFGYVVEGLDVVTAVCDATMTAQEEEAGRGVPEENITIVSVTVVE